MKLAAACMLVVLSAVAAPTAAWADAPGGDAATPGPREPRTPRRSRLMEVRVEPSDRRDPRVQSLVIELDEVLRDTVADLGLELEEGRGEPLDDDALHPLAKSSSAFVIAPSVRAQGDDVFVRIVVASPVGRALALGVERTTFARAPVRAAVMLRDLLDSERRPERGVPESSPRSAPLATPTRSDGRLTLAVNATLFGGAVGFAIQHSSGSDDPRLLYPLLALGAGVGLGGSVIVAEEWDVGTGDAWYLSAGAWWPSAAGLLIYEGRFAQYRSEEKGDEELWTYALIGGTTGVSLSVLGLTLGHMGDGGAVLAHSGGGLGMVLGGITELAVRGDLDVVPEAGMGYGAAVGWASASTAALFLRPSPGQVLAMDLGAALGGLGGAALGSPLLFDEPTPDQQRAWLGATAGAAIAGGTIAVLLADDPPADGHTSHGLAPGTQPSLHPEVGVIDTVSGPRGATPVYGLGVGGTLQ